MAKKTPEVSNAFRVTLDGNYVDMSFGTFQPVEEDKGEKIPADRVRELSCARFDVDLLKIMVTRLMEVGIAYQEKTGKDIGFDTPKNPKRYSSGKKGGTK